MAKKSFFKVPPQSPPHFDSDQTLVSGDLQQVLLPALYYPCVLSCAIYSYNWQAGCHLPDYPWGSESASCQTKYGAVRGAGVAA